jgi:glycosyltransferase involved in cell wall biosynthesis
MRDVPSDRRLLFVGQLFKHKNVQVVVDALPAIRQRMPDTELFVAGPPAQGLRAADGVVYLGVLSDGALGGAYELATVLVMPSLHETIGLPMPEAMSAGTVVAAADRPYAHDVCLDAAVFFDPLDADDCARQIADLLLDPQLQRELSGRGHALVAQRARERPYQRMLEATLALTGV